MLQFDIQKIVLDLRKQRQGMIQTKVGLIRQLVSLCFYVRYMQLYTKEIGGIGLKLKAGYKWRKS